MPCWTSTMIETKLEKIDMERARRALLAAGYKILVEDKDHMDFYKTGTDRGTVFANGTVKTDLAGTFQKAYAAQTIRDAAKRFGWNVGQENTTKTGLQQLHLSRR